MFARARTRLFSNLAAASNSSDALSRKLVTAEIVDRRLVLKWEDGLLKRYHPYWLRDNCSTRRHPETTQKLYNSAEDVFDAKIRSVDSSGTRYLVDAATSVTRAPNTGVPIVPRISYANLRSKGDEGLWESSSGLARHGSFIIENVPAWTDNDLNDLVFGVRYVAELFGPLQPNIYGETFDVQTASSDEEAINIAYTTEACPPHMDLMYYESPPGLQLLHCLRFDEGITGGGSFLIDGFAVAEKIRKECPSTFKTLSTIPATFIKDHSNRANPVLMSYQRPHIAVDPNDNVNGMFWSPPFEGPLRDLSEQEMEEYYHAYAKLDQAIKEAPTWEYRLKQNEMLVFNNRRMLHGRDAFSLIEGQVRHLQGCYVNIDEFANRYNLLKRRFGGEEDVGILANQDWAQDVISLSK